MSGELQHKPGHLPISVLGTLAGTLAIFAALAYLLLVYPVTPATPTSPGAPTPEEMLREVRDRDHETLTTYGWVDREKGVLRIPADRAMELWLAEHGAKESDR